VPAIGVLISKWFALNEKTSAVAISMSDKNMVEVCPIGFRLSEWGMGKGVSMTANQGKLAPVFNLAHYSHHHWDLCSVR
jgi:hypothetical protein